MSTTKRGSRREFIAGAGLLAGSTLIGGSEAHATPVQAGVSASGMPARFRAILARNEPVMSPGVHDVISARLCELEGFEWLTVGGSAASASVHGIPDFGLVSITELIEYTGGIAEHVNVPVLADADDGGGSPINVYRAIRKFERAGLGAVMIEDTVQVKHLKRSGNELVSRTQFADKIKAAVDSRRDGLVIVARTDAISEGMPLEEAHARGVASAEAGADVIFFAGMRLEDCARAKALVKRPLMSTVNSNTPPARLKEAGINVAVYAGQLLQIGAGAMLQAIRELKTTGTMQESAKLSIAGDVYQKVLGSQDTIVRGTKYNLVK